MKQRLKLNKGFSFIELIIAIALLSIIMIMISGFISSTLAQFTKTKKNVRVQSSAQLAYNQMADTIMQAEYFRLAVSSGPSGAYAYVPDYYANYIKDPVKDPDPDDREIILNMDTYQIVDKEGIPYPMDTSLVDKETEIEVHTFRELTDYVDVEYIYLEYMAPNKSNSGTEWKYERVLSGGDPVPDIETYLIYYYNAATEEVYMYRSTSPADWGFKKCLEKAKSKVGTKDGLLAENVTEFKVKPNVEGNAVSLMMKFDDNGYKFDEKTVINFRNTNVLTAKPQYVKKIKGTGAPVVPIGP